MKDKVLWYTCIVALILCGCHLRQYSFSGNPESLLRLIFCSLYPIGMIVGKRKFVFQFFILYSYALLCFNGFNNYTSFAIIMIASYLFPDYKRNMIIIYAIICSVSMMYKDNQISHFIIHGLNCLAIYYGFTMMKNIIGIKPLDLTKSEVKILDELIQGKTPKEVTCYSTNTVYKRIQEAKTRNDCISTSELLFRYKSTITFYH